MNDCQTICRACNRASNGEEYCARCEGEIARKESADSKRGFALPVRPVVIDARWMISDSSNVILADLVNKSMPRNSSHELAEVIAAAINEHYTDETEGA